MKQLRTRKKTTLLEKAPFLLSFFIPVLIMIGIFVQRGIFPFGDNSFLRTDMYHQYAPFMNEFMEKLKHGGSLLYSWNIGMGSNFAPLYAYYLASPVNWLVFLVPQSLLIEFMTYLIVIKIGLSGLAFSWYLSRRFKTRDLGIAFFAIFYALSAYMAAYSWNIMWLDCLILAPIVMLGLEQLVKEDKCLLYCLSLALSIITNYYISIMMCIFMVIYFIALMVMERDHNGFFKKCVNFAIYSLLSGGLAAFLLIPVLFALKLTASGDVSIPKTLTSYFSCFEMLARHFVNVETETGLDHWPNIYCGVAVLLLFPLYMMNREIPKREKIVKGILLFVMLLGFSLNIPNFIWHGFHFPNSLPARQSFLYIILLLTMCYEGYRHIRANTAAQLTGSFWGVVIFIFLCEAIITVDTFDFKVYYVTLALVGLYALLLYYHKNRKAWAPTLAILAFTLVAVEASMDTAVTSVSTVNRTAYLENQDSFRRLSEAIDKEDASLFRMEKVSRKTKNDAALAGYRSASLFSSTANAHLSDLYKALGLEGNTNAYSFSGATPLTSAILGVKYTLSTTPLASGLYTEKMTDGEVTLYENRYSLPIGFMVSSDFESLWDYKLLNPVDNQNSLAQAAGADDILMLTGDGASSTGKYTISISGNGFYYVDVTNTSIKDVSVSSAGNTKSFSNVNRGYLLDLGYYEAGSSITLTTEQSEENFTANVYRLDLDALQTCIKNLGSEPFTVDSYSDTTVTGRVTASESGLLYTSIPYETGWTVKVDGIEVEPQTIADTMLAIPVSAGSHSVELTYCPDGMGLGILISVVSLILLILLVLSTRAYHKHQLALSAQDQELSENQRSAEAERRAALRGTKRVLIKQPEIPGKSTASDGSSSESTSNKQPDSETQSTNTNNVITTEQPSETITDKTETQMNETAESEEQES